MLHLLEWLRRLDASVFSPSDTSDVPVWGALLAVLGGFVVLGAGMLLQDHAALQLAAFATGMLLMVPYLQQGFDKAKASARS